MNAPDSINLSDKLSQFSDYWNPRIAAKYNDNEVRLAKLKGAFDWHNHADTDELFLVLEGGLDIEFRGGVWHCERGDMIVVPKGVEHRPFCKNESHVMIMDRAGEPNTGVNPSARTRDTLEWIR